MLRALIGKYYPSDKDSCTRAAKKYKEAKQLYDKELKRKRKPPLRQDQFKGIKELILQGILNDVGGLSIASLSSQLFGAHPHQVIFNMLRDCAAKSHPRYTKAMGKIQVERDKAENFFALGVMLGYGYSFSQLKFSEEAHAKLRRLSCADATDVQSEEKITQPLDREFGEKLWKMVAIIRDRKGDTEALQTAFRKLAFKYAPDPIGSALIASLRAHAEEEKNVIPELQGKDGDLDGALRSLEEEIDAARKLLRGNKIPESLIRAVYASGFYYYGRGAKNAATKQQDYAQAKADLTYAICHDENFTVKVDAERVIKILGECEAEFHTPNRVVTRGQLEKEYQEAQQAFEAKEYAKAITLYNQSMQLISRDIDDSVRHFQQRALAQEAVEASELTAKSYDEIIAGLKIAIWIFNTGIGSYVKYEELVKQKAHAALMKFTVDLASIETVQETIQDVCSA